MPRADYKLMIPAVQKKLQSSAELSTRQTFYETAGRVIDGTPVDTGACKAHWYLGNVRPSGFNKDKTDKSGSRTKALAAQQARGINVRTKVYLTNTAPYCNRLEHGWSKQQPNGWIMATVASTGAAFRRLFKAAYGQQG